ncbi:MAG: DUF2793 domain-containing protein, partial [Pseudomonadota bacterium]
QLSVISAVVTTPPSAPTDGMRYILPPGASGLWAGNSRKLTVFDDNAWAFYDARAGWLAWAEDAQELLAFDGANWIKAVSPPDLQNLAQVGVGTSADAGNPLTAAGPATLLTHAGAGHQLKLNKASEADTASLLFQTNWSGRAELGTTGSDDFEIKVSGDGSSFRQVLVADRNTGAVRFPSGIDGLTPTEFGTEPLATTAYITAKGDNLVTNGTGLLGNGYNYPPALAFDPVITPNLPASFRFSGHHAGLISMSEPTAVDPNQVYRLNSYLRQESTPGDWSAFPHGDRHRQYMGVICLDQDGNAIVAEHHMRYKHAGADSLTTLTAPLSPGDTTVAVSDASGWNESEAAAYQRGLLILGYKNSLGYTYSHYSRFVEFDLFDLGQVDKTAHIITLNKPLPAALGNPDHPSGTWPAGTRIANCSSGGAHKYAFYHNVHLDETDRWYRSTGYIGGIDTSGTNALFNFPPGTTFVRPFWLPNHSNRNGAISGYPDTGSAHSVWFAGVSVRLESMATQEPVTSGTVEGSKTLKVPLSDPAAGTISLVSAAQSIVLA